MRAEDLSFLDMATCRLLNGYRSFEFFCIPLKGSRSPRAPESWRWRQPASQDCQHSFASLHSVIPWKLNLQQQRCEVLTEDILLFSSNSQYSRSLLQLIVVLIISPLIYWIAVRTSELAAFRFHKKRRFRPRYVLHETPLINQLKIRIIYPLPLSRVGRAQVAGVFELISREYRGK